MAGDPKDIHCRTCSARAPHLRGERRGEHIHLTCLRCGSEWDRYPDSCAQCGQRRLVTTRVPLVPRPGMETTIVGSTSAYHCTACGASSPGAGEDVSPPPER